MRKSRLAVLVLSAVLVAASGATAAPLECDAAKRGSAWSALLERLEPLLSLVLPESVGPGADPDGATTSPPDPETDVGPGADPDG